MYFLNLLKDISPEIDIQFDVYGSDDHPAYTVQCRKIARGSSPECESGLYGGVPFNRVFDILNEYH